MIINKSAYERGFGHASVYKTFTVDLDEEENKSIKYARVFVVFFNSCMCLHTFMVFP